MKLAIREKNKPVFAPPPPPSPAGGGTPREPVIDEDRQGWLLKSAVLTVGSDVRMGVRDSGRAMVKSASRGRLLGITQEERALLEIFRKGQTVSEVLSSMMIAGKSPPVSEVYELVLKAVDRGILVARDAEPPPRRRPLNFPLRLPPVGAIPLIVAALGFGVYGCLAAEFAVPDGGYGVWLFGLFETGFNLPRGGADYFWGILSVLLALSLGSLLGAAVVRSSEAEVYPREWPWKVPMPYLSFDFRDVGIAGRTGEVITGLARLAPSIALLGAICLWFPNLALVVLAGMLWFLFPARGSAVAQMLSGITGRVPVDTQRDLCFEGARRTWRRLLRRLSQENRTYVVCLTLAWLVWATVSVSVLVHVFPTMFEEWAPALVSTPMLSALATAAVLLLTGLAARAGFRDLRAALRKSLRQRAARQAREAELARFDESTPPPPEKVAELLKECVLFGGIDRAEREGLARRLQPRFVRKGEVLVDRKDDRNRVFLVFKGRFEVCRELASGRPIRLAILRYGDVFGTVPLWQEPPRVRVVRALDAGIVYSLSREEFSAIGLSAESCAAVKDAVKASFLMRVRFFREWPRDAVRRFAQAGSFVRYPAGRPVVQRNDAKPYFHILYDGVCEYTRGHRRSGLRIGDFFGEIAMFSGAPSTVEVVCREDARFLVFGRNDFLRAICEQPEAVLAFENRCSRRLGRPVFPLRHRK